MSNPAISNNPALKNTPSADELRRIYDQPSATAADRTPMATEPDAPFTPTPSDTPMTYENTISKTVLLFLIVIAGAAIGWFFPLLMIPGLIVGFVLGLVNSFKKQPSPALIITYAAAEGLFLGGISSIFEMLYPGIVTQAVLGTFAVFGVTLLLFRSGRVRTSPKATKIFFVAMIGYAVFSLLNLILMWTGVNTDPWGMRGAEIMGIPLGLIIGALAVLLAAYSLVMDFEFIKQGVERRVPERWSWSAAFGLTVTMVWLYLEILRILAILRGD